MATDTVTIEKLTRTFETGKTRFVVTAEIKQADRNVAPYLTVDLLPIPADAKALSICADIYEKHGGRWADIGGGQAYEELRGAFPNDPTVARLCDIWRKYHLCDMQAGTREQKAIIDEWAAKGYPGGDHGRGRYDFTDACMILESAGMLDVPIPEESRANFAYRKDKDGNLPTMYRYGSAWLSGSLPSDIEAELRQLMTAPPETPKQSSPEPQG